MALLTSNEELQVQRGLTRSWSRPETAQPVNFLKGDLLAAIQAANTFIDGGITTRPATSFNAMWPEPFKTLAIPAVKWQTWIAVCAAQAGNTLLLRRAFGEVD